MDKIKLATGLSKIHAIDKSHFERITGMVPPYYPDGERTFYPLAVCPQCDNPVQIIGFYKEIMKSPYGKHYPHSVIDLAAYEQSQYEVCPYHDRRKTIPPEELSSETTPVSEKVKEVLRDYFDQVVYFAGKQLGIYISDALAEDMLRIFVNGQRWLYPWITLNNLPWIFVYLSWSKNLYGRLIEVGSWLYKNLANYEFARFEECSDKYSKLTKNGSKCFQPSFKFMHHKHEIIDEKLKETILYRIDDNVKEIYSVTLEISETAFVNLLVADDGKRYRKDRLLAIAKKYL